MEPRTKDSRPLFALTLLSVGVMFAVALTGVLGGAQEPPAPDPPVPAVLRTYQPVTAERLRKPEDAQLADDSADL